MRSWRWAVVAAGVAVLAALPSLAGALPVRSSDVPPAELAQRIRASAAVPWSGYAESRGTLVLPDVRELGEVPGLVGGTTRMRTWWRGPKQWRIDTLSLTGETDVIRDADGTWTWESADQRATRIYGTLDIRLPQPPDLLPSQLGRRLVGADDVVVSAVEARRVAGRSAAGVRLTPRRPGSTTVAHVDVWAEPRTGLPLRVDVTARGRDEPSVSTSVLDLSLERPPAVRTAFEPPPYSDVRVTDAPDIAAQIDRFAPFRLPRSLAGLRRSDVVGGLRPDGGLATYGDGLTSFAVLPLPRSIAGRVVRALSPDGDRVRGEARTSLVNAVAIRRGSRAYLAAGTVPVPVLDRAIAELFAKPPPEVFR